MAKFLTTAGVSHLLEELIKTAEERIVLLSPYLKLNDRLRELLAERSRSKVNIQIVYGKKELDLTEERWLREVPRIKTKFRRHLHAKCYLTEKACIITSLNLHEFSQQNNDEMGVFVLRKQDEELYREAEAEVRQIVKGSTEVNLGREDLVLTIEPIPNKKPVRQYKELSTTNLAKQLGLRTTAVYNQLIGRGWMNRIGKAEELTDSGRAVGGREQDGKNGKFIVWPANLQV